ncbi:MAG: hypothetical protein WBD41_11775 [Rhodococcus sp. (in: high G+C Gram-positive bacteria)]|uniref:hypothetical protein n=1 Tax=Rhodococcus sp. EPR-157 TaxID=1813677 RepID=UPI0007BBF3A2|nr:hypothetical protein [Rhodococcus sp. EPR-157]KZF02268.1 hypothetical protein A2J03_29010 [Rhodococcus sp. EPR-157]
MQAEVTGVGFREDQLTAIEAGLTAMSEPDARVAIVDDFVDTVQRLTENPAYSAGRGAGIVAAKTIHTPAGDVIVFNAPELRNRDSLLLERLAAHEAGHVKLGKRGEGLRGRQHLVDSEWRWQLMCLGALAIDELRIERALADLAYPVALTGDVDYTDDAMFWLNCELMNALVDPANSDVEKFHDAVMSTQDWLTKHLAYVAAYNSSPTPDLSALSSHSRQNWNDYIAAHWGKRIAFYENIPDVRTALAASELDPILLTAIDTEADLLSALGFRLSDGGHGQRYAFHRISSDAQCDRRLQRAREEFALRDSA